jgi:predicted ester cyclase
MTILADFQTRQVFPLLFTSFPDASSIIEQQTVEGTWVTTRTTLRGTHLGAFMGEAPTGKAIEIMHLSLDQVARRQGCGAFWRVGLVASAHRFRDRGRTGCGN